MATIKHFTELVAWQKARTVCLELHGLITREPFRRDFGLRDQINRSCGSIMDNIAEGFDREGTREFIQYLSIAKASATEVHSQLFRALDRGHINSDEFSSLETKLVEVKRLIAGLMKYLRESEIEGNKYKRSGTKLKRKPETEN